MIYINKKKYVSNSRKKKFRKKKSNAASMPNPKKSENNL